MAKNTTRTKSSEKHFDKDKKHCVFEVFRKAKTTVFHNRGSGSKDFAQITLDGFTELPTGLYLNRQGYGMGRKGFFLLGQLKRHLSAGKTVDLIISNRKTKSIKKNAKSTSVVLPFDAVKDLLVRFGRMNEDNNNELRATADQFLGSLFPTKVKATRHFGEYQSGEVASLLRRKNVAKKLNQEDLQALNGFFPSIFEGALKKKGKGVKTERDALIRVTKTTTDRIFLDDVIREFESNLRKKTLKEQEWQSFLKDKVFRFMTSHVTTIEKQNVSLNVSYPDFVMVDVYGFIDIYEIKRHDTQLLAYDASHENYYWKPELVQAIAQIENYIDAAVKNADEYSRSVMKKKQVEVRVNRPRGYIIAGTSAQFETTTAEEDFHKLGNSLKNINFVLYDELLAKLKICGSSFRGIQTRSGANRSMDP